MSLSPHESIRFSTQQGIATITLNRPEVYNSFDRSMALALQYHLDQISSDPSIRVIVIRGNGKAFCAGQDLKEVVDPNGPDLTRIVSDHFNPIVQRIRAIEKPVVAAVHGVAAGAGANIALACDLVLAAESASFIQAFSKIGLIPDSGGTYFLPRLVGLARATALMMLGDKVTASEAERIGMIYRAVPDREFEDALEQLQHKLASMPTIALGLTKRALNDSMENGLSIQLRLEELFQTTASQTDDYHEGVRAFLEKRAPQFKGK
ncbi:MAG: enoyl-CoA hydratase/isomerase family protein [Saprospiraceae bacterium]|nr:enoyl-CoA hydratase/isomerase family protein [Saprospiraceae bacterium]MCB9317720.1 enoyl-CoA hydratase/isomerase family protein [Lewinellaceae bacterium]